MSEILDALNPEQLKAVTCTQGPMLIVAGAGSGKTRVLTSRIAYLIEQGVAPERILALTFTKKAAGEMKERIGQMVGDRKARRIWMGTFHSVFIRFLREYADYIGFPSSFTIYDTQDSVSCIKTCMQLIEQAAPAVKFDPKVYKPKDVLSRISLAKNALITPTPYAEGKGGMRAKDQDDKRGLIYLIYKKYCDVCRQNGVMDFDDILLYMNVLLKDSNKDIIEALSSRYDHILVDEYQDTNYAQYRIIKTLANRHRNICVVGDDSQSIYGFRGAQIQNILNFRNDFSDTRIFRLESNYRSTATIVNAANALIAHNEGRIPKNCVSMGEVGEKIHLTRAGSEQEEAMLIASSIISRMQSERSAYEDFAILYRTNAQSRALEEQLRRRNIPYMIYSGNSFYERMEVKDLMAYFKLAVNLNDDESFKRIVNKPARGIGATSLVALTAAAQENGVSLFKAASLTTLESFGLKAASISKIRSFTTFMEKVAMEAVSGDAYDVALSLANEGGLYLYYKNEDPGDEQCRFHNVEELLNSVKEFVEDVEADVDPDAVDEQPHVSLSDYLENVSLLSNVDVADDETNNKVALMTVHTAKGLEFPYVYVSGLEECLFPSYRIDRGITLYELEEERRLFYVAITRAKKAVSLSFSDTRIRNGKHEYNRPSRFLREIAPQYLDKPLLQSELVRPNPSRTFSPSGFGSRHISESGQTSIKPRSFNPTSTPRPYTERPFIPGSDRTSAPAPSKPPVIDPSFVPDPMTSFRAGDRIEHNRFGAGEVLEILGEIPDLKAKVRFDDYGEKLLLLKFAKLRHL